MTTSLVICQDCDLVYNNPRPSVETLNRYYRSDLNASGQIFRADAGGGATEAVHLAQLDFLAQWNSAPKNLLDVGCGRGFFLKRAAVCFPEAMVAGLEPSVAAAEAARSTGLNIHGGTLADLAPQLETFAMVCAFSVLEHVADPLAFLKLLRSLIAENGHLFLEVPESTRPVPGLVEFFDFEHLCHFTGATLQQMLQRAGFQMVGIAEEMLGDGRLVVCAVPKGELPFPELPIMDREQDKARFLAGLTRYQQENQILAAAFRTRLLDHISSWVRDGARIGIYGAGVHTEYLLGVLAELESVIFCLLDTDPRKQGRHFHRWRVFGPEDIPELDLDGILISSQRFEDEIFDALQPFAQKGLSVIRCYGD